MNYKLNEAQKILLTVYGGGDYAYLIDPDAETRRDIRRAGNLDSYVIENCGDTQFLFLLRELSDDGSAGMPKVEAVNRINNAITELQSLQEALEGNMSDG